MKPKGDEEMNQSSGDIEMEPNLKSLNKITVDHPDNNLPMTEGYRSETEVINVKPQPNKKQPGEVKKGVEFVNFDESEQSTCIESITFVKYNLVMGILVVPLLCLTTGLILALVLYWHVKLQIALLYRPVSNIKKATHVVVHGKPGNIEICKIYEKSDVIAAYLKNVS